MSDTLLVNEIFLSLQGESTLAGLPCIFVRLTGCNLRCSYCDTAYAFTGGTKMAISAVYDRVLELAKPYQEAVPRLPMVELTGGEPLLQAGSLDLMKKLCDAGFTMLLETNGAVDITPVDARVHRIVDLKCPSTGEVGQNRFENISHLRNTDEIKFVIATTEDYAWAKEQIGKYRLNHTCPVLFSWAAPLTPDQQDKSLKPLPAGQTPLTRRELVEKVIADALPVRFQLQMHKFIWPPDQRGV